MRRITVSETSETRRRWRLAGTCWTWERLGTGQEHLGTGLMRSESVLTWRERAASNLLTVRSTPMATMIDDTLISLAMVRRATHVFEPGDFRHIARVFDIPAVVLFVVFVVVWVLCF